MTSTIKVLGQKLQLIIAGTARPRYASMENVFPSIYAWAPDSVEGIWKIGTKVSGHELCEGKGDTLEEAEKDFVASLKKYNGETQKSLANVTALLAASCEFELTPGPESICVREVTFTRNDSLTVQRHRRLTEIYAADLPYTLERTRASHHPREWWNVVCSAQCFTSFVHDTPEEAIKEAAEWMQGHLRDCTSDLKIYQERFDSVKNAFDSLNSLSSGLM